MASTVVYLAETILPHARIEAETAYYLEGDTLNSAPLGELLAALTGQAIELVLSVSNATLTEVELNRRQARHLEKVLPYMLEESLLNAPETLWFSYRKSKDGQHYPVVICDKGVVAHIIEAFAQANVRLLGVWIDADLWSELAPLQVAFAQSTLLLPSAHSGLRVPTEQVGATFAALGLADLAVEELPLSAHLVQQLEQRIQHRQGNNLLHGEFAPQATSAGQKMWRDWRPAAYFSAVVFALLCVLTMLQTREYQHAAQATQQQSVKLYQQYFPGSSPPQLLQRQFETQLRRLQQSQQNNSAFMQLMYPVGQQFSNSNFRQLTPRRIQFDERDGHLSLDVSATEFAFVERFSNVLKENNVTASIGNSRTESGQVRARLKVE